MDYGALAHDDNVIGVVEPLEFLNELVVLRNGRFIFLRGFERGLSVSVPCIERGGELGQGSLLAWSYSIPCSVRARAYTPHHFISVKEPSGTQKRRKKTDPVLDLV